MRNYDYLFILSCLFVLRIIAFSGSYPDALCLISLLAYKVARDVLQVKKISNEVTEIIKKNEDDNNAKLQALADELLRVKNSAEGLKAAINFVKR